MIIKELYGTRHDGVDLYLYKSDEGYYIRQTPTGILYDCAIDIENAPYTYEETDQLIQVEENNGEIETEENNNEEKEDE